MCSNFVLTFIIRQVLLWGFLVLHIAKANDTWLRGIVNAAVIIALMVMVEGSNYCSMRSKALLFLRIKVMSKQEE